jgi:hypothetical protein
MRWIVTNLKTSPDDVFGVLRSRTAAGARNAKRVDKTLKARDDVPLKYRGIA